MYLAKDIKEGDLIVVAYGNYLYPAIYKRKGSKDNPNFYLISERRLKYLRSLGKVRVDYINRWESDAHSTKRSIIAKIDEDALQDDVKDIYTEMKYLLKLGGNLS